MNEEETISNIIEALEELQDDEDASKQLKAKIASIIFTLKEPIDLSLRVDKTRSSLEELEGMHIPNYLRTQLWNVAAMIELL